MRDRKLVGVAWDVSGRGLDVNWWVWHWNINGGIYLSFLGVALTVNRWSYNCWFFFGIIITGWSLKLRYKSLSLSLSLSPSLS